MGKAYVGHNMRSVLLPYMVNDMHRTTKDCELCASNQQTKKQQQKGRLFPAAEPLEFITIDILRPLPKTNSGNEEIVMVTDRFSKLTKAILTKTTARRVVIIFLEN